jgi:hypothetical protein
MRHTLELTAFNDRAAFGDLYPIATSKDACRLMFQTAKSKLGRWTCTRESGHDGPHVAHNSIGNALAIDVEE